VGSKRHWAVERVTCVLRIHFRGHA
jgi:hypothetical protein